MAKELADAFGPAREVFQEVDDALSQKLSRLMWEGPEADLTLTENAQPAIMANAIAVLRVLEVEGGVRLADKAAFVAGHSLGEYSALCGAQTFDLATTSRLLKLRGQAMQAAVPVGAGAMAALLGADFPLAESICAAAAEGEICQAANDNGGGQVVISGHKAAVERAMTIAKERGVKRAIALPVSAPFHCALMQPAADGLAPVLAELRFAEPAVPVVTSVDGRVVESARELPGLLERQVTAPVRWEETARVLAGFGAGIAIECGPGRTLAGLMKRIVPELPCVPGGDLEGVEAVRKVLG